MLVAPAEGKPLVYWGTPKVVAALEPTAWPRVSRARTEGQANSVKRMIDHGALAIHDGRKTIVGPDRHQQRGRDKRDQALEAAHKRGDQQAAVRKAKQAQGAASESKGHGQRLAQRQRALAGWDKAWQDAQHKHAPWTAQAAALGPPKARADRDFRQQTIMTLRTLLVENALGALMALLCGQLPTKVSLDCILRILCERSGARMETASHVVYWVNPAGLSVPYRRMLTEGVEGLWGMDWREQDKPMRVCLKDMPP